jgi:nucleotide-binding universal stress UspA family protein
MKDKLITIATDHYTAAEILKAKLENAGIDCFLKNVNLLQGAVSEGVKVQIRETDLEKAMRIIMELKANQEKEEFKDLKSIRRILVPVDFSQFSKNACLYALELAKVYDADLKIFHVYYAPIVDLVPITDAYSIQVDMDINLREMEEQTKRNLSDFVTEIKEISASKGYDDIKISYSLREGIVEDEIALMAKTYKPGIIILGTKGKGKKQTDIIGSVVHRVLDKSRIPVLAIPEGSTFKGVNAMKNIVYATTFDDSDYVAIRKLIAIVTAFDLKIHCVHISKDEKDRWDEAKMDNLKEYFKKIHSSTQVECNFIRGDNPVTNLETYCNINKIDLIAVTSHKRGLLMRMLKPGLAKKLIRTSNLPLLLFKA